jgi:hypothetical protein
MRSQVQFSTTGLVARRSFEISNIGDCLPPHMKPVTEFAVLTGLRTANIRELVGESG